MALQLRYLNDPGLVGAWFDAVGVGIYANNKLLHLKLVDVGHFPSAICL